MKSTAAIAVAVGIMLSFCLPLDAVARTKTKRIERLLPERDGMIKLGYTYSTDANVENEPGSFSLHVLKFKGGLPIPLGENAAFIPGVTFDWYRFDLDDTVNYLQQNSLDVYTLGPTFDAYVGLSDNWMLAFNFMPLIASDLKGLGWNDILFRGYGLAGWAFSEHASFLFGIAVNNEFWRYLPIPVIGFVVRPKDSFFSLETLVPAYLRTDFRVASWCKLFLQAEFEGDVWWVRGDGSVPDHHGKFMDLATGAGARFKIIKGLELEAWGGVNPFRRVEFKDRNGQIVTQKIEKAYFAEANLVITPELFGK